MKANRAIDSDAWYPLPLYRGQADTAWLLESTLAHPAQLIAGLTPLPNAGLHSFEQFLRVGGCWKLLDDAR